MKRGLLFSLCIVSALFVLNVFCRAGDQHSPPTVADSLKSNPQQIVLKRRGCEGTCPVYTLTLESETGRVHFHQTYPQYRAKDTLFNIAPSSVHNLFALLEKNGFWQMKEEYISDPTFDLPTSVIILKSEGQEKQVLFNGRQPLLDSLAQMIDGIAKIGRIIGTED